MLLYKDINAIPISSVVDTLFFDLATTSSRVVSIVCYFKTKTNNNNNADTNPKIKFNSEMNNTR